MRAWTEAGYVVATPVFPVENAAAPGGPDESDLITAANDQTVVTLAQILQRAGAVRAMQFDINPEWPTLITYTHHGDGPKPTKVVPNVQQPASRYLVADDRDFFTVYRRLPGPVTVPFK